MARPASMPTVTSFAAGQVRSLIVRALGGDEVVRVAVATLRVHVAPPPAQTGEEGDLAAPTR